MRSFCFEIIYGILLIVQKGHSTPDGQRVALNVRPLQPKRFFLAKPAVQTEGAEYAGAWFYDYTHQNIDLSGKQSLFLFRFSVRGDFDTLSRIINNQMIQTCFLKKLAHSQKNFTLQAFRSGCNAGHMAKTKEITIGEQKFTLQSVSPSWYYDFNDECGNTGSGKRKSAKYMDGMFKNCVVAPAEVKAKGMEYFDDNEDLKTAEKLIAAIEQFLRS